MREGRVSTKDCHLSRELAWLQGLWGDKQTGGTPSRIYKLSQTKCLIEMAGVFRDHKGVDQ